MRQLLGLLLGGKAYISDFMNDKSDISDQNSENVAIRYDRLSSLMANFEMRVRPVEAGQGNIAIYGDDQAEAPTQVQFWPLGHTERRDPILEMRAEWGGAANPLIGLCILSCLLPFVLFGRLMRMD